MLLNRQIDPLITEFQLQQIFAERSGTILPSATPPITLLIDAVAKPAVETVPGILWLKIGYAAR